MTYISRCEHGTPMALCQKCFPDVSEHNDWSNYKYTHPVKELTDEEIDYYTKTYFNIHPDAQLSEQFRIKLYELQDFAKAILRKAQEK